MPYDSEDEAVSIANDTLYGLSAYVQSGTLSARRKWRRAARRQRPLNGARPDLGAPFGGYKQSGNGREWGDSAWRSSSRSRR